MEKKATSYVGVFQNNRGAVYLAWEVCHDWLRERCMGRILSLIVLLCVSCTRDVEVRDSTPIIEDTDIYKRVRDCAILLGTGCFSDLEALVQNPVCAREHTPLMNCAPHLIKSVWSGVQDDIQALAQSKREMRASGTLESKRDFEKKLHEVRGNLVRIWALGLWYRGNYAEEPTPTHVMHFAREKPSTKSVFVAKQFADAVVQGYVTKDNVRIDELRHLDKACRAFWRDDRQDLMRKLGVVWAELISASDLKKRFNVIAGVHARYHDYQGFLNVLVHPLAKKLEHVPLPGHTIHMTALRKSVWPTAEKDLETLFHLYKKMQKGQDSLRSTFLKALREVRERIVYTWAHGMWEKVYYANFSMPFYELVQKAGLVSAHAREPAYKTVRNAHEFARSMIWLFQQTCGPHGADIDALMRIRLQVSRVYFEKMQKHKESRALEGFCDLRLCSCGFSREHFNRDVCSDVLNKRKINISQKALTELMDQIIAFVKEPNRPSWVHALTYDPLAAHVYKGEARGGASKNVLKWWPTMKSDFSALAKLYPYCSKAARKSPAPVAYWKMLHTVRRHIMCLWAASIWEKYNPKGHAMFFGPYEVTSVDKLYEMVGHFWDRNCPVSDGMRDTHLAYVKAVQELVTRMFEGERYWADLQNWDKLKKGSRKKNTKAWQRTN